MFSENMIYQKSLERFSDNINWNLLKNKSFLVIGATGLIGTYFIDLLMYVNEKYSLNMKIIAVARNEKYIKERFIEYLQNKLFEYCIIDINQHFKYSKNVDYILHLASNTHPVSYSKYPIETLLTNILGTYNVLNYAKTLVKNRIIFLSSVEIYGEPQTVNMKFKENDCGYINCNTLRAVYNEGKRAGEALCQAFINDYDMDIVIARLCRVYGPTMRLDDSKALSQFLKNGLEEKNIVLKSEGNQYFSYLYVGDVVNALLFLLMHGENKEAYNISDSDSDIKLKDLAKYIADQNKLKLIFDMPNEIEKKGFSKSSVAILDSKKINELGWKAKYDIFEGIKETLNIMSSKI